jgi:serine O-acetyltransferase
MATERRTAPSRRLLAIADRLLRERPGATSGFGALPTTADVAALTDDFLTVLFPESGRSRALAGAGRVGAREHLAAVLGSLERRLEEAVFMALHRRCGQGDGADGCEKRARAITDRMLNALPGVRAVLADDVSAAFDADPAATSLEEIVACYPGLYAIAVYRAAHRLLQEGAEIVPRMMTEHAHSRTGIDIHPGATIGHAFFIDHGTGIVIGETTVIGNRVRIYQGVTLGALSVRRPQRDGKGAARPLKRHPTIEDDVIIYANATILGGETVIGRGAVVGGNAWITYSVPAGIRVGVGT